MATILAFTIFSLLVMLMIKPVVNAYSDKVDSSYTQFVNQSESFYYQITPYELNVSQETMITNGTVSEVAKQQITQQPTILQNTFIDFVFLMISTVINAFWEGIVGSFKYLYSSFLIITSRFPFLAPILTFIFAVFTSYVVLMLIKLRVRMF